MMKMRFKTDAKNISGLDTAMYQFNWRQVEESKIIKALTEK